MEFEYDPAKSAANLAKHGLDFRTARALWDVQGYETDLPYPGEARWARVAQTDGVFWTAIFTERGGRTRIISVRRARKEEAEAYVRHSGS